MTLPQSKIASSITKAKCITINEITNNKKAESAPPIIVPVGQPCLESDITKEITGPGEEISKVIESAKVKYKESIMNNLKRGNNENIIFAFALTANKNKMLIHIDFITLI